MGIINLNAGQLYRIRSRSISYVRTSNDEQLLNEEARGHGFSVQQHLFDQKWLRHIRRAVREAQDVLTKYGHRFRIFDAVFWVPEPLIAEAEERLELVKQQHATAVQGFKDAWPHIVHEAEAKLGDYFNPKMYPSPESVDKYFHLDMLRFELGPSTNSENEFNSMLVEFQQAATLDLLKRISEFRQRVVKVLTPTVKDGKTRMPKIFESLVEEMKDLCDHARDLVVDEDPKVVALVDGMVADLKDFMGGYNVTSTLNRLRRSDAAQERLKNHMDALGSKLSDVEYEYRTNRAIGLLPARKK